MRLNLFSYVLITSLFVFSCSKGKKEDTSNLQTARFTWSYQAAEQARIKIFNHYGEPISQAQILIGMAQNNPFPGNFIQTGKSGVAVVPSEWNSPQHITIDAPGFIRETLLNQAPGDIVIRLKPTYLAERAEVNGTVTQLPVVNGDKLIDFALVMPVMTRSDLLNFDMNMILSPYSEVLTVAGQSNYIPSNVSLPTQKENYFFNLTLSKPVYRMYTPTLGPKSFYAARGQFPFKTVVDELRDGKQFHELLNHFSIQGGGIRDINLLGSKTTLDIPGSELTYKSKLTVQPSAGAPGEVVLLVAVSEVANSLIPTDIKRATSTAPVSLASLTNTPAFVVNAIKRESEFDGTTPGSDRISAGLYPYTANIKTKLLPLVENPKISTTHGYQITLPKQPLQNGIHPIAMSAAISDLVDIQSGESKITNVNRRWEVTGLGWSDSIQLPQWPLAGAQGKKRVEINFIGSMTHESVKLDDELINAATHVTHASTDF